MCLLFFIATDYTETQMKKRYVLRYNVSERLTRIVTKIEKYYISGFFQFCGNSSAMFDVV